MEPIRLTLLCAEPDLAGRRRCEPMTCGLPMPRGALVDPGSLSLVDADGQELPLQVRVLDRWSDQSVRWLLVDTQVTWSAGSRHIVLGPREAARGGGAHRAGPVSVTRSHGAIVVDTGVVRACCRADAAFPFERVTDHEGRDLIDAAGCGLRIRADDGTACPLTIDRIEVECDGPVRARLRWRGRIGHGRNDRWLELDARADFFAGSPVVRMGLTVRNPHPARHRGNFWELGDSGSVLLREAALVVSAGEGGRASITCSVESDRTMRAVEGPLEIYQESSGGTHWQSPAHVNRHGRVPMTRDGYRLRAGASTSETGRRASPVVALAIGDRQIAAVAPQFWQNFPRAMEARGAALEIGLWPRQFPDVQELQGGEQKTHEVALAFGADQTTEIPLHWCRVPAVIRADPAWYCGSGVLPGLTPAGEERLRAYDALVASAIEGADTFAAKRERIDEFGWRHFGDIHADHESALAPEKPPLVSHYNNQYDAVAGLAVQFLRSGDPRWWTLCQELASHVADIDVYHTGGDKSAYSGGLFWHTSHYVDAGRSTHRSYPRSPGVPGGGPSAEHCYATGLALHYYLTGDDRSRESAVQLADWVLHADDGSRTVFRWLDRGDTGLASATGSPTYHGPGRGAGNSIRTLLVGYRLTGEPRFLEKAEVLVRRSIHPRDDIDGRDLLNAELRWSYTVMLEALGEYLDEAAEGRHQGPTVAWARQSLLHYARWMAEHEFPYLDRPERLQYPTETWAAQDMRKCEVFLHAARHAGSATDRRTFLERADFFFRASTTALAARPTRTLARPVVILLSRGFRIASFASEPEPAWRIDAPRAEEDFGAPLRFVPQRQRAIARARWIAAAGAVLACAVIAAVLTVFLG